MNYSARLLFSALAITSAALSFADFKEIPGVKEFSGELIVRPLQSSPSTNFQISMQRAALQLVQDRIVESFPEVDEYTVRVPSGMSDNAYAKQLSATGLYEYVQPNWTLYPLFTPNDPQLGSQWHHTVMESRLAWDFTFGASSVIIAVTDTGILATHEDLAAVLVPGFNAVDNLAQASGGAINDINGHGTHVAGCAAAIGNNARGVVGSAGGVRIMPIRVSNSTGGGASTTNITRGARWAADNGAKVVSSSYSGVDSATLETTGAYIRTRGALYLYAAGNDSRDLTGFDHPNVTVVGATQSDDTKSSFSAFGRGMDLFAPGSSILSTVRTSNTSYGNASGTSMATPVANGVAALIFSINPSLSPEDVETLMEHGCQDYGALGEDTPNGWGRVNSKRSVILAQQGKVVFNPAEGSFYERVPANLNHSYASTHSAWRRYYGLVGKLATVRNANEQSFLTGAFTSNELANLRLGALRTGTSATTGWAWGDGSTWSYTNWQSGQPSGGTDNTLAFAPNGANWVDVADSSTATNGFLVEYVSTPVTISGTVNLQNFVGSVTAEPIVMEVYLNNALVTTANVNGGSYSFTTLARGNITVRAKGTHWLSNISSFEINNAGASGINFSLINGDVNNDNEVGPSDFAILSTAFGTELGGVGFVPGADLNGDNEVGPSDFAILSTNFGQSGL